jgi:ATP-dependent Clp protease ATP-binding subunit ClpA
VLDRFSAASWGVLGVARAEADRLGHNWLGCEHVFLALLHDDNNRERRELADAGISLQDARSELARLAGPADEPASPPRRVTPRLTRVLEQAEHLALFGPSTTVEPEHITEALLAEDDGVHLIMVRNLYRSPN